MESSCYENNYSHWIFLRKCPIADVLQGFEYARVLHMSGFWIYQSSEYATVLNVSRLRIWFLFCIYQGSIYTRVKEGSEDAYALLMFKFVWICQNMRECTFIYLNGFCFKFLYCDLFRLFFWGDKIWFFLK